MKWYGLFDKDGILLNVSKFNAFIMDKRETDIVKEVTVTPSEEKPETEGKDVYTSECLKCPAIHSCDKRCLKTEPARTEKEERSCNTCGHDIGGGACEECKISSDPSHWKPKEAQSDNKFYQEQFASIHRTINKILSRIENIEKEREVKI